MSLALIGISALALDTEGEVAYASSRYPVTEFDERERESPKFAAEYPRRVTCYYARK